MVIFVTGVFGQVFRQKMQKLDFPEFVEKKRGGIQKLMEVAHVLVGMTPPGSLIYGILDHGFVFLFGFWENITNSQKQRRTKNSSQNEV